MLIVPNHHVIVPKTEDQVAYLPHIITDPETRRKAHIQKTTISNQDVINLNFTPLSDQWVEVYVDGYRLINPKYPTYSTKYVRYDTYNILKNNILQFSSNISGNIKIICDTLPYSKAEILHTANISGLRIFFDNVQSYDVYEKRFIPSRYPMPALGLINTLIRIRVGDALYCEPVILSQPCHGYVRLSLDRKSLVYVPRVGFQGWDVFGYSLISQHGQMGKPASFTIRVGDGDLRYNWSANLDSLTSFLTFRNTKHTTITALATKKITFEFYYFCKGISSEKSYKVGVFGQYKNEPKSGRYAIYLQGNSESSDHVLVFQYCISGFDILGNSVYNDYKISSRAKLTLNRWHHIVIQINASTSNNTTVNMYLDGFREDFYGNDFTSQNIDNDDYFFLGGVNDSNQSQYLNGYLSNFRILVNDFIYFNERIDIPRRPLANIANVRILTVNTGIQDPQSVQDMYDLTKLGKVGNIQMIETGPFSPVLITADKTRVRHGDEIKIAISADYICSDQTVPWAINSNVFISSIDTGYIKGYDPVFTVNTYNSVDTISNSYEGNVGNFVIDDIDYIKLRVSTLPSMETRHRIDFYLREYPLVIESIDVFAEQNGLVYHMEAENDGFARDKVNFNHGTLTSFGMYNSSLGGYFNFNGSTYSVNGVDNFMLDMPGDVSCEIWFRIQSASLGEVYLLTKGNAVAVNYALTYNSVDNKLSFIRNWVEGNIRLSFSNPTSLTSNWYQLVAVTDGVRHKIYLNAEKKLDIYSDTAPYILNKEPYVLGTGPNSAFHNGQISVVKIYNRALSDSDVTNNFNVYRHRYGL